MAIKFGTTVNPLLVQLLVSKPLRITDGQIDPLDWLNFVTQIATITPSYQEGTFVGTITGCTTAPTQTYKYIQVYNFVLVTPAGNLTANSNSTACTITGLPAAITPQVSNNAVMGVISSGAYETAYVVVGSNGVITLGRANGTTTFVNDGAGKGLASGNFAYTLAP